MQIIYFFKDFWNLSRWDFYVKYILPFVIIFFTWAFIGNIIELNYSIKNLNNVSGKIISINNIVTKITNKSMHKSKDYELQIYLENHPKYFRLTGKYNYQKALQILKNDDIITISIRPKYLVPIGMGRETDIYQLKFKNNILFDVNQRKKNSKGIILISSISLMVFGTIYYLAKRKKTNVKIKAKTN